ncbi:MAG: hypothetical protein ACSHYA_09805 [Opitutaceae bacterium]
MKRKTVRKPRKEFNESDWIMILGSPIPKRRLYASLIGLVLFLGLCGVTISVYLKNGQQAEANVHETTSKDNLDDETLAISDPLEKLLKRHLAATNLDSMVSLIAKGTYLNEKGLKVDLKMLFRQPNMFKQVLEFENRRYEFGISENQIWSTHSIKNSIHSTSEENALDIVNRHLVAMQSTITAIAWLYKEGTYRSQLERTENILWRGIEYGVIKNTTYPGIAYDHYINLETGLEKRRVVAIKNNDEVIRAEVLFDDPDEKLAYGFPSGYQIMLDGKTLCTAKFDSYETNEGVMSYLFQKSSSEPKKQ